ncbi:hypothetical protein [Bacillus sp. V33-4]|nr:hypothetical protein [Bacillus sp. V33-4]
MDDKQKYPPKDTGTLTDYHSGTGKDRTSKSMPVAENKETKDTIRSLIDD